MWHRNFARGNAALGSLIIWRFRFTLYSVAHTIYKPTEATSQESAHISASNLPSFDIESISFSKSTALVCLQVWHVLNKLDINMLSLFVFTLSLSSILKFCTCVGPCKCLSLTITVVSFSNLVICIFDLVIVVLFWHKISTFHRCNKYLFFFSFSKLLERPYFYVLELSNVTERWGRTILTDRSYPSGNSMAISKCLPIRLNPDQM